MTRGVFGHEHYGLKRFITRVSIIINVCVPNSKTMPPIDPLSCALNAGRVPFWVHQKRRGFLFQATLPSNSMRAFFPYGSRPSWGRLFARMAIATIPTIPTTNPINTNRNHLLPFPIETIKEASYECHEEVPRWWKRGVITSPFKLCNLGLSFGPARIFRSARFGWSVWMDLSLC